MSNQSDSIRSGGRVTLPPIRVFFREEFMDSQPPAHEPPSATLARLRMNDDETALPSLRPTSSGHSRPPSRMYRSASDQLAPPATHRSAFNEEHLPSNNSGFEDQYPSMSSSPILDTRCYPTTLRRPAMPPSHRPSEYSMIHPHSIVSPHSSNRPQDWPMDSPNHQSYPSRTRSSPVQARETNDNRFAPIPRLPTPPNPAGPAQGRDFDSPPALVQAVPPWIVATNMDVGQIYEDEERTTIARPFDAGSTGRPTSHVVSLGRLFDDGSQPPMGKYDCRFCGKLFNRPSSLRIHLNSHTGEKPFVCPYPDCGRSFSVLSNMRRHARVHTNHSREQESEDLNDEASQSSSTAPSTPRLPPAAQETPPAQTLRHAPLHYRQDSNVSASSSSSMRSLGASSSGGSGEARGTESSKSKTK